MSFFDKLRRMLGGETSAAGRSVPAPDTGGGALVVADRRERPRDGTPRGMTVLIVDDSPTVVATLRKMLEQNGCVTLEALTGEDGVELARSEAPDLVFLDIVLPEMDGFSALRRLRRDPITQKIPVIMMSGNEAATEQFYAQRIGANDFMKKPFSRFEVFSRVERLIESGQLQPPEGSVVWPTLNG